MIANVLSIAGSDPSGGAGIQADMKTFSARGTYGMAVLTALTAQNTQGVSTVHPLPGDFVEEQIRMIFADVRVDAVKIGMMANADIAKAASAALRAGPRIPVVLDPVMIAKGGAPLLTPDAIAAVKQELLPLAFVLTPNLPESAALLQGEEATDRKAMEEQARALLDLGPKAVLLKGGHLGGETSPDVLVTRKQIRWFDTKRIDTKNTHGTGCTLSSAIAAELAKGCDIIQAVAVAKAWLATAISRSPELQVGQGHGPVHHFHSLWPVV